MNTHKPKSRGWQQWQMDALIQLWPSRDITMEIISERIGKSSSSISEKAKRLGLPSRKPGPRTGSKNRVYASRKESPRKATSDGNISAGSNGQNRAITLVASCASQERFTFKRDDAS